MPNEPKSGVIIVAGGSGRRMGASQPKQFLLLGGQPVLVRTINAFAAALPGAQIVAVLPADHIDHWRNLAARFDVAPHTVVAGGRERFHSVRNGLAALPAELDLIAVHDGVRPLASAALIRRTAAAAAATGAAIPAIAPVDSYRLADADDAERTQPIDRRLLRAVQTPQIFRAEVLRAAYESDFSARFTDDASVVEHSGHAVALCAGERRNLKITTAEDLLLAEALLAADAENAEDENAASANAASANAASANAAPPPFGSDLRYTPAHPGCCRRRQGHPRPVTAEEPDDPCGGGAGAIR